MMKNCIKKHFEKNQEKKFAIIIIIFIYNNK